MKLLPHFFLLLLASTAGFAAEAPIAIAPDAYTSRQYRDDAKRYWREFHVGQYQKHGKKNEAWDSHAIELLERAAAWDYDYETERGTRADLELARRIVKTGCEDALVLLACSIAERDADPKSNRLETLVRAEKSWRSSGYSSLARLLIIFQMNTYLHWKPNSPRSRLHQEIADAVLDTLNADAIAHEHARHVYRMVDGITGFIAAENQSALIEPLSNASKSDPWLVQMLMGSIHRRLAWHARGGGFANTVTPEGWKGFHERIPKARDCFRRAWELEAKYPEAPTALIEMSVHGETPEATKRIWFDRAVAAQCDYRPAYSSYSWYIRPRWGGSQEAMFDFATTCANTKRYDTEVPLQFPIVLRSLRHDQDGAWTWYAKPGVYESLTSALEGRQRYLEDHGEPEGLKSYWTEAFVAAYKIGRYDDARKLWDRFQGKWNAFTLEQYVIAPDVAHRTILAFTGPFKEQIAEAQKLVVEKGDLEGAVAVFEKVIAENQDPALAPIFKGRSAMLRAQADLIAGKRVLLPTDELMSGWNILAGKFVPQPKSSLLAISEKHRAIAFSPLVTGPRFEIEATLARPKKGQKWRGGAFFLADPDKLAASWRGFDWQPMDQMIALRRPRESIRPDVRFVAGDMPGKMRIQCWDGLVAVYVHDDLVFLQEPEAVSEFDQIRDFETVSPAFGLGVIGRRVSDEIPFQSATVQLLQEPPASPRLRLHRLFNETYRLADAGAVGKAVERLNAADRNDDPETIRFVQRSLENRARTTPGVAIDLLQFGVQADDWRGTPAAWEIRDGALVASVMNGEIRREFALDLEDYELSCRVEWNVADGEPPTIELYSASRPYRPAISVRHSAASGLSSQYTPSHTVVLRKPNGASSLSIRMKKQGDTWEVAEEGSLPHRENLEAYFGDRFGCVGFVVRSKVSGGRVTFRDLKLTPLTAVSDRK